MRNPTSLGSLLLPRQPVTLRPQTRRRGCRPLAAGRGDGKNSSSGSHNSNNNEGNAGSFSGPRTLTAHQNWLHRQRVLQFEPDPSDADIIELNCGGSIMVTSRSTLRQFKGSLLWLLFDPVNSHLLRVDGGGRVFLDHDPAAFGLLLRHLRDLRAAPGSPASVPLPAIPPSDASSFRSLNQHLGLGIPEAVITAAVLRGVALMAATTTSTATTHGQAATGVERVPASPYASRPAPNPQSHRSSRSHLNPWQQQQQWQRCSSPQQHQQHPVKRPSPGNPGQGRYTSSSSSRVTHSTPDRSMSTAGGRSPTAGSTFGASGQANTTQTGPRHQQQQWQSSSTNKGAAQQQQQYGSPPQTPSPLLIRPTHSPRGAARPTTPAAPYSAPVQQHFCLLTSPVASHLSGSSSGSSGSSNSVRSPLRVTVYTDAEVASMQGNNQKQQQGPKGSSSSSGSSSSGPFCPLPAWFDVFCSTSSSRELMTLSLVAQSGAALDNMFVGVTSSNQVNQRGLQIPCFGWHQMDKGIPDSCQSACGSLGVPDNRPPANSSNGSSTRRQDLKSAEAPGGAADMDCDDGCSAAADKWIMGQPDGGAARWRAGDLVQLVLEAGSRTPHKMTLKVNGQVATSSGGSSSSSGSSVSLPCFEQWCWYVALFRGTEGVAVVFEAGSVSVYSGDTVLKKFLN